MKAEQWKSSWTELITPTSAFFDNNNLKGRPIMKKIKIIYILTFVFWTLSIIYFVVYGDFNNSFNTRTFFYGIKEYYLGSMISICFCLIIASLFLNDYLKTRNQRMLFRFTLMLNIFLFLFYLLILFIAKMFIIWFTPTSAKRPHFPNYKNPNRKKNVVLKQIDFQNPVSV